MTREDALEFGNMWLEINEDSKNSRTYKFFQMAIKALEQEPRWISVSEKKPNKGGKYLLWGKIDENEEEDYCFIGDYHEFDEVFGTEISKYDPKILGFIDSEIEEYYSVVAWIPLPKPYKAEK